MTAIRRHIAVIAATATVAALAVAGLQPASATAGGPSDSFQRGPDPTVDLLEAPAGPFAIDQIAVPVGSSTGFASGVISYPTDTSVGTFGAVAMAPGFIAEGSHFEWLGPYLASHGFVVIIIDTLVLEDFPAARGVQLQAALDYLVTTSSVSDRIDADRLAVMGHSMGGGGALHASQDNPALQASILLMPWHFTKDWPGVQTPTLVIGAEFDAVAAVEAHAEPIYEGLSGASEKAYLELDSAHHLTPKDEEDGGDGPAAAPNVLLGKYSVAWLKLFVDDDIRYEPFLCGPPHEADLATTEVVEYRDTCLATPPAEPTEPTPEPVASPAIAAPAAPRFTG